MPPSLTPFCYLLASSTYTDGQAIMGVRALMDEYPAYSVLDTHGRDAGAGPILGYAWISAASAEGLALLSEETAAKASKESNTRVLSLKREHAGSTSRDANWWVYPRAPGSSESLRSVSAGGVTISSNMNAGGSVWEWWWRGRQFINDYDYGRQLSMAVYTEDGESLEETGDKYGDPGTPFVRRHSSPLVSIMLKSKTRQVSRAIPLEWDPDVKSGGPDNPVIYPDVKLGKNITLNWSAQKNPRRNWPVVMYESVYEGPPLEVATVEAPTAYLLAEFNTYYAYNPKSDSFEKVTLRHNKVNMSGGAAFGLIVARGSGLNATSMGVYIDDPNAGLVLYDNSGPSSGKYGSSFSKWGVVYRSGLTSHWTFRTWIATDSLRKVQGYLRQLHAWNVKSRDVKLN